MHACTVGLVLCHVTTCIRMDMDTDVNTTQQVPNIKVLLSLHNVEMINGLIRNANWWSKQQHN